MKMQIMTQQRDAEGPVADSELCELSDLQLALIGGGIGETTL